MFLSRNVCTAEFNSQDQTLTLCSDDGQTMVLTERERDSLVTENIVFSMSEQEHALDGLRRMVRYQRIMMNNLLVIRKAITSL